MVSPSTVRTEPVEVRTAQDRPVKPRTDESLAISGIPRSPLDKLRANGGLNQTFLSGDFDLTPILRYLNETRP